jgi:hypothetical protein
VSIEKTYPITNEEFYIAALNKLRLIFSGEQLFFLAGIAQRRKAAGFGTVAFSFFKGQLNEFSETATTKPAEVPGILLQSESNIVK